MWTRSIAELYLFPSLPGVFGENQLSLRVCSVSRSNAKLVQYLPSTAKKVYRRLRCAPYSLIVYATVYRYIITGINYSNNNLRTTQAERVENILVLEKIAADAPAEGEVNMPNITEWPTIVWLSHFRGILRSDISTNTESNYIEIEYLLWYNIRSE